MILAMVLKAALIIRKSREHFPLMKDGVMEGFRDQGLLILVTTVFHLCFTIYNLANEQNAIKFVCWALSSKRVFVI